MWPVEASGLGIQRIGLFNQALLGKWFGDPEDWVV